MGPDLGVSPAAWDALRVTDEILADVAAHGVAPDPADRPFNDSETW